jgi:hypothetical protein
MPREAQSANPIGTEVETMRNTRPSIALGAFLVITIGVLVACGGAGSAGVLSTVGNSVGNYGGGQGAASAAPSAAPAAQQPGVEPAAGDGVGALIDDAKIVRTGSIDVEVKDLTTALRTARDGIRAMGGYIGASQTKGGDEDPFATVTYRVPVDRWEEALDLLRGLSGQTTKILNEQTQAVEVTSAVVDLEARIKNLRASEAALQAISARAGRVSDVLEVQSQLTTVRGEIEQLTAQLKELNDRSSFATLTATLRVPVIEVQAATERWEPARVVDRATASLVDILQSLITAGIWFAIVWLPILLVLGGLAALIVWVLRRIGVIRRGSSPAGDLPAAS